MRHFLTYDGHTRAEIEGLLERAAALRAGTLSSPASRTAPSPWSSSTPRCARAPPSTLGIHQLGGQAVVLEAWRGAPGRSSSTTASIMDGEPEEHVQRGRARALALRRRSSRARLPQVPALGGSTARTGASSRLRAPRHACPSINTGDDHAPLPGARARAGAEGAPRPTSTGKKFVLDVDGYHPQAAQHRGRQLGALIIAAKLGMDVTLLCPHAEYVPRRALHGRRRRGHQGRGQTLTVTHDIEQGYHAGADVVYAKSWGALPYFGRWEEEKPIREARTSTSSSTRRRRWPRAPNDGPLQPLPAGPAQRQGHRRGDRLACVDPHRRGREPPARSEGRDGRAGQQVVTPNTMGSTQDVIVRLLREPRQPQGGRTSVPEAVRGRRSAEVCDHQGRHGAILDEDLEALATSLVFLNQVGLYPVVIHGAGPQRSIGRSPRRASQAERVNGLRVDAPHPGDRPWPRLPPREPAARRGARGDGHTHAADHGGRSSRRRCSTSHAPRAGGQGGARPCRRGEVSLPRRAPADPGLPRETAGGQILAQRRRVAAHEARASRRSRSR